MTRAQDEYMYIYIYFLSGKKKIESIIQNEIKLGSTVYSNQMRPRNISYLII